MNKERFPNFNMFKTFSKEQYSFSMVQCISIIYDDYFLFHFFHHQIYPLKTLWLFLQHGSYLLKTLIHTVKDDATARSSIPGGNGVKTELHVLRKGQLMGAPSLNGLAVDRTLNTIFQYITHVHFYKIKRISLMLI